MNLQENGRLTLPKETINSARQEVHLWLKREELLWKQRSLVDWLREGDVNTKYFRAKASARRRRRNSIKLLQINSGTWVKGEDMEVLIIDYFKNLFSTSG